MKRRVIALALAALGTMLSLGQTVENRFRLAQSYEQGGDFENAVKLYRELALADTSNYMFFDGLRRSLLQLKRYDEAIGLIRHRLLFAKTDLNLLCLLGSALNQSGQEKEAMSMWEQAIAVDPTNANIYRLVSNSLLENRLLERTAELYRRARKECNDPNLFTLDLAQLLGVMMDYSGATTEFLRYLAQNPTQLGYVQNRLAQFTGKEEARSAAFDAIRSAKVLPDELTVQRLYGWLLMEGKAYGEALEAYKKIDKLSRASGNELYVFGDRAYRERAYGTAAEAYRAAIDAPLPSDRLPYAKFGYALAVKELSALADSARNTSTSGGTVSESQSRYVAAIDHFRRIIAEYPNSELAARSYYQVGLLKFEKYFDLDDALASFSTIGRFLSPTHTLSFEVALKMGEVLTAKGDTIGAAQHFRKVVAAVNSTTDQQDEATYRLAELEYFSGNVAKAIELLQNISTNLKANYTNDALQLLAFLQENALTAEVPLKQFARGDFLTRQKKYTEAITVFESVIGNNPRALFVDEGLMKIAALQTGATRYGDALATYQKLLRQFKESSIALDKAQFSIAALYDYQLNDKQSAIASYEKLLVDYPKSLLVDAARRRIRELRGDSL